MQAHGEASDLAARSHPVDAILNRGAADLQCPGQGGDRLARVGAQKRDESAIEVVHGSKLAI